MLTIEQADGKGADFFTVEDLRRYLNIGSYTTYKLMRDPTMGAIKLGNKWLIPKASLEKVFWGKPGVQKESEDNSNS